MKYMHTIKGDSSPKGILIDDYPELPLGVPKLFPEDLLHIQVPNMLIYKRIKQFSKKQVISKVNKLDEVDFYRNMGVRGKVLATPKTVGLSKSIPMEEARNRLLMLLMMYGDPDI